MKLIETAYLTVGKNKKKVKCNFLWNTQFNRRLAVHEDIDNKKETTVSDVETGRRLFSIKTSIENVKEEEIAEGLESFIKHYTLDLILERFKELDVKKENNGKQE